MDYWLRQLAGGALIALITAALVAALRRTLAARHRSALAAGKAFRFDVSLQGNVAPYPRHFRAGWVMVGVGAPTWKPRFSFRRIPIALPMSAVVYEIRRTSGVREFFTLDSECRVIVARAGDIKLDLAVFEREIATALRALESATGGGWRVPFSASDLEEPVEEG